MLFEHYGIELSEKEKSWFALDGKELKGSILPGDTRGEAVALAVRHEDRKVYQIAFFNGSKESEVTAVRTILKAPLTSQKITVDALHFKPLTLLPIHKAGGVFLASLKENQPELLKEMIFCSKQLKPTYQYNAPEEKAHGRIDQRQYWSYNVAQEYFDKRWKEIGFKTLVKVERNRIVCNRQKHSLQVSYFLCNKNVQNEQESKELFSAIRQHWQVEAANNARDCILKEDKLRCTNTATNRTMALARTLVIKLLNRSDIQNRCELMDHFADDFDDCIAFLKAINFL